MQNTVCVTVMVEKNADTVNEEKVREYVEDEVIKEGRIKLFDVGKEKISVKICDETKGYYDLNETHITFVSAFRNVGTDWFYIYYDDLPEDFFEEEITVVDEVREIIEGEYNYPRLFTVEEGGERGDVRVKIKKTRIKESFTKEMRDNGFKYVGDDIPQEEQFTRSSYFDKIDG